MKYSELPNPIVKMKWPKVSTDGDKWPTPDSITLTGPVTCIDFRTRWQRFKDFFKPSMSDLDNLDIRIWILSVVLTWAIVGIVIWAWWMWQ